MKEGIKDLRVNFGDEQPLRAGCTPHRLADYGG